MWCEELRSRTFATAVRWTLLLLAIQAALAASAGAEVHLALPAGALPRLRAIATSPSRARLDLAAGLSRALARTVDGAVVDTAAATGPGQKLRSDAFVLASTRTAQRILSAWRRAHRASGAPVGDGGFIVVQGRAAAVAWRSGPRIGVLVLSAPGADPLVGARGDERDTGALGADR